MSRTGPLLEKVYPILRKMPDGLHFTANFRELEFIVSDHGEAAERRKFFPGAIWKKEYNKDNKWWEFHTTYDGYKVRLFGVYDAPATCRAIVEKKVVTKRIPTAWREEQEEVEVIVGWDCTDGNGVTDNGQASKDSDKQITQHEEHPV